MAIAAKNAGADFAPRTGISIGLGISLIKTAMGHALH
jgi:hypothetical protein